MNIHAYILLAFFLVPAWASAQANLNPPAAIPVVDDQSEDFSLPEFETNSIAVTPASGPRVVGTNEQGQTEYSVLENSPGQLVVIDDGQQGQASAVPQEPTIAPVSDELNRWFTSLILKHMPHEYANDKKWGKQTKRWAGINFRRDSDDSRLETKRRYKMVNHGTWQKYAAELIDPNHQFAVQLGQVSKTKDGKTAFDVGFSAALKLDARQSKWVKGVQMYSVSAKGTAKVRLVVSCELGVGMDISNFPPDLIFSPEVKDARIVVDQFKLNRISKVGGELAQQVSRHTRKELENRIQEKERKLVTKLNKEIDENRDKLRLSIAEAIRLKWYDKTRDFLPDDVQNALASNDSPEHKSARASQLEAEVRSARAHTMRTNKMQNRQVRRTNTNRPTYPNGQRLPNNAGQRNNGTNHLRSNQYRRR